MVEIWCRSKGTIHTIARLNQNLLDDVLLKVHILTGCDVTSKIWTKSAALKSDPHMYLKNLVKMNCYNYLLLMLNYISLKYFRAIVQLSMNYDMNCIAKKTKLSMTSHLHHNLSKGIWSNVIM